MRRLEMWVEIHELNEQGEYTPVEVASRPEVLTGGVFQLRQVFPCFFYIHWYLYYVALTRAVRTVIMLWQE